MTIYLSFFNSLNFAVASQFHCYCSVVETRNYIKGASYKSPNVYAVHLQMMKQIGKPANSSPDLGVAYTGISKKQAFGRAGVYTKK